MLLRLKDGRRVRKNKAPTSGIQCISFGLMQRGPYNLRDGKRQ